MGRALAAVALLLAVCLPAHAKFGITKTKVMLPRLRPPELLVTGERVSVTTEATARRMSDRQLGIVRDRVEQALQAGGIVRVVDGADKADTVVRIEVDDLEARIDDRLEYETKYVKIGERQEWDDKKKKYVKKDVWGNRQVPVRHRTVTGRLDLRVLVDDPAGQRNADAIVEYSREFEDEKNLPDEARSEQSLEDWLVEEAAFEAAAKVAPSPDPVEALLAVDGPLKKGNDLAERGQFREAIALWERLRLKGDQEAARQHNLGVAHEALAYELAPESPEHRAALARAAELYGRARELDPGEKYFADPLERIDTSIRYAETALRQAEERRTASAGGGKTRADARPAPDRPAPSSGAVRNGGFDAVLAPWVVDGRGGLEQEKGRGGVFEASPATQPTLLTQPVRADLARATSALLRADYRVLAGEPRIRFTAVYTDATGRTRTHVGDVTAGEPPGRWSEWSVDLKGLRPAPAQLSEIRFEVEGGTVLLDDVGLEAR